MLSKEQINSAMMSSLEGFSFSVVDSLEFELSRKLTASEQQEVFVIVERAVSESTVAATLYSNPESGLSV
ncbi:hypothetical protein B7R74_02735 [Yersinia pseudotuberculosis]|uniref:hypothetical protein n=1 Tax=Yersinia pseudotuberculosis TaxID=633 RepID=UPI000D0B17EF|nr:hypothetical protein [Yersinia pseudotuberculosis]PSH23570.1 hypothetical protein B7R74_02735 [Yersinia pseudotuberculosis]